MKFSPGYLSSRFIEPIRYFFSNYSGPNLKWDLDPKLSTIEIESINNFDLVNVQMKPRILVSRGGYSMNTVGLTDNLAEQKPFTETYGITDRKNMILLSGQVQILIQAKNEGTCEIITDMLTHFIGWSAPFLCDTQHFKSIGKPIVSPCTPNREDVEIFEVSLGIPWSMEEMWETANDGLKLKQFFMTFT